MLKHTLYIAVILAIAFKANAQEVSVYSPNNQIEVRIKPTPNITWSVYFKGKPILNESKIQLQINDFFFLGKNQNIVKTKNTDFVDNIISTISTKNLIYRSHYKGVIFTFKISDLRDYEIEFRVYNDGVAYRFITNIENEVMVKNELIELNFPKGSTSYFPEEKSFISRNEPQYKYLSLDQIGTSKMASLPVLIKSNGINMLFNENNVFNYPNMYLKANGPNSLKGIFPMRIEETRPDPNHADRKEIIVKEEDNIAITFGKRNFPWRSFIISKDDAGLVSSNLSFTLAGKQSAREESWIKPGHVVWDWYNANQLYKDEFDLGITTDTYKYYIDFAAKYGFEYVLMGEGWSRKTTDIVHSAMNIRMKEIVSYAKEKNVGIILWVLWKPLNENMDAIMKIYQKLGIKGIKVDFMQRNDQDMVKFYERVAKTALKYKLIVDFHGSFKPGGMRRTYPNILAYEAVRGNKYNKWSHEISSEYTVQIPFIRMAAGPMDFAPGAMSNAHYNNHKISYKHPSSLGTRTRQMAMYVIYESPLQMLCDGPTAYDKEPKIPQLISRIPTTWDETIVLNAKIGEKLVLARRKGYKWYLAGMAGRSEQIITIKLANFLPHGKYKVTLMKDGVGAKENANSYSITETKVSNKSTVRLHMVSGGGSLAIFEPLKPPKKKKHQKKKKIKNEEA